MSDRARPLGVGSGEPKPNRDPAGFAGSIGKLGPRFGTSAEANWYLACLALGLILVCGGCLTLVRRSPAKEDVVAARELSRLGLEALDRGRLVEAEARFKHALQKCPHDVHARHHYARALWERGQREQAIEEMDTAVRNSGGDPEWAVELGQMLLAQNELDSAEECCQRALDIDHRRPDGWALHGEISKARGDVTAAQRAYHRALSCGPADPAVLLKLAELYRIQGRPRRALSTLQRLAEETRDAPPPQLCYLQGVALQALARHEEAIEQFTAARQQLGDQPELLLMLAESQFQAGQIDAAQGTLQLAAKIIPRDSRVANLGQRIQSAGQPIATVP